MIQNDPKKVLLIIHDFPLQFFSKIFVWGSAKCRSWAKMGLVKVEVGYEKPSETQTI